jgi:hypothetical protein
MGWGTGWLRVELGHVLLADDELRQLRERDAVLVDADLAETSGSATLVAHDGRHFAATFEVVGGEATVMVVARQVASAAPPEPALRVATNLCRKLYDVRELPVLEAGAVVKLPCEQLVLTCQDRVIAFGVRIEIDRDVGVRIERLGDR